MTTRIKFRRDTAANWTASNPVLALGEPGLETDSRKVKYGDGTTAWNLLDYAAGGASTSTDYSTGFADGINDNTWHFVDVPGKKEFTFETEGYKVFEITLTTGQLVDLGSNNLTFNVTDVPEMTDLWFNYSTAENEMNLYTKTDYDANQFNSYWGNMSNPSDGVYVLSMNTAMSVNSGDKIVIKYWSEGTTYTGSSYDTYDWSIPDVTSEGAVNTITFDPNEFPWMPWDAFENPANVAKHSLVFQFGGDNDNRNITNVVVNGNGTVTATFDGAAKQIYTVEETTFTYTAPASDGPWGCTIPLDAYPTFAQECHRGWNSTNNNKYTGNISRSGWVIINGGSPINFNWYQNYDSESRPQINFFDYQEIAQGDTIEVHFYKQLTTVTLSIYNPNPNNWNNGFKWFDWKDDIATEYSPGITNGILSGRVQFIMKNYVAEESDFGLISGEFGWIGSGNNTRTPYDPYRQDWMSNWGDNANYSAYPFYRFDTDGVVFYSNDQKSGSFSRTMKVRIMYRFKLEIGEDDQYWFC